jgi:uncharacterized membrane protein YqaE (UPF0057 family)
MKSTKLIALFLFAFALNTAATAANRSNQVKKTAETVYAFANQMETMDAEVLKSEIKDLSIAEKVKLAKMAMADAKNVQHNVNGEPSVALYILAVLIPPLAVGLYTDWKLPTLFNLLWTLLGWFPGVVHAFIVLSR